MEKRDPNEYLSAAGIKARGWTDAMIKHLLGEPDETAPNPHYRSVGAPMRLYLRKRVETAEQTEAFRDALTKAAARSAGSRAAAERAKLALVEAAVRRLNISSPQFEPADLTAEAISHYNQRGPSARQQRREDESCGDYRWMPASVTSDPEFLNRIKVNFLRHVWSNYDKLLNEVAARIGVAEAKTAIRDAVLDAIAKQHPDLAEECECQRRTFSRGGDCDLWRGEREPALTPTQKLAAEADK